MNALPRWMCLLPGAGVTLLCAWVALRLVPVSPVEAPVTGARCGDLEFTLHPTEIHLSPALRQHQSWVSFEVEAGFRGFFTLCLDGDLLLSGSAGREPVFPSGVARFNLSTTWVDVLFLRGTLEAYRDTRRWELRLLETFRPVSAVTPASLPLMPILQEGEPPFAMFADFPKK